MANTEAIKAAMQRIMKEKQEQPNSGTRPPNLQVTEDSHKNCSTCEHFNGAGLCKLYSYNVQPDEVCDEWTPEPK